MTYVINNNSNIYNVQAQKASSISTQTGSGTYQDLDTSIYFFKKDQTVGKVQQTAITIFAFSVLFQAFAKSFQVLMKNCILRYCADGTKDDKIAFKAFFKAESLINEYKLKEAIKVLESIRINHSDSMIYPITTLRMALLSIDLMQFEKSIISY